MTALDVRRPAEPQAAAALAIRPGQVMWDEYQTAALDQLGLRDATNADRAVFLHQCQRTGLDPFSRQIYMIPRPEKQRDGTWRTKWTIQTGIDGFRVNRARAERLAGVRGTLGRAVWYDHDGNEFKVWVRPEPPAACEITYTVRDAGGETPYTSVLQFAEYVQLKDGRAIAQWATKPAHMLEKCTEADVYRKAFPQDFAGVSLDDAMPPADDAPAGQNGSRVTAADIRGRTRPVARAEIVGGTPDPSPAGEPPPPVAASSAVPSADPAGEAPLPPLPGEEETAPGPEPDAAQATTGQVGMMQSHFKRLGFEDGDREQRLAAAAVIAGLPEGTVLASLKLLTQDQAKAVIDTLSRCKDRERLIVLLAGGEQDA